MSYKTRRQIRSEVSALCIISCIAWISVGILLMYLFGVIDGGYYDESKKDLGILLIGLSSIVGIIVFCAPFIISAIKNGRTIGKILLCPRCMIEFKKGKICPECNQRI